LANVPHFVKGEPGFADKLNQLGSALTEALDRIEKLEAAKAPAKPASTRKTASASK